MTYNNKVSENQAVENGDILNLPERERLQKLKIGFAELLNRDLRPEELKWLESVDKQIITNLRQGKKPDFNFDMNGTVEKVIAMALFMDKLLVERRELFKRLADA